MSLSRLCFHPLSLYSANTSDGDATKMKEEEANEIVKHESKYLYQRGLIRFAIAKATAVANAENAAAIASGCTPVHRRELPSRDSNEGRHCSQPTLPRILIYVIDEVDSDETGEITLQVYW